MLSFVLDGQRTEDVGAALDKDGIAVRRDTTALSRSCGGSGSRPRCGPAWRCTTRARIWTASWTRCAGCGQASSEALDPRVRPIQGASPARPGAARVVPARSPSAEVVVPHAQVREELGARLREASDDSAYPGAGGRSPLRGRAHVGEDQGSVSQEDRFVDVAGLPSRTAGPYQATLGDTQPGSWRLERVPDRNLPRTTTWWCVLGRSVDGSAQLGCAARSAQGTTTASVSATHAGLSEPSTSTTTVAATVKPIGLGVTESSVTVPRTFDPTGTGVGKRTLLQP